MSTLFDFERQQHLHIAFTRELDSQPERKKRRGHSAVPIRPQDRSQHAIDVLSDLAKATEEISSQRNESGILPGSLIVLECRSVNSDLRVFLEERFNAWIVDESKSSDTSQPELTVTNYRYLVQFPSSASLAVFQQELDMYRDNIENHTLLTQKQRQNFFDGLQTIRRQNSQDRLGCRLLVEGLPTVDSQPFFIDVDFWHPGDANNALKLMSDIRDLCRRRHAAFHESTNTSTLLLAKIKCDRTFVDELLNLDIVARIDLSPIITSSYERIVRNDVNIPSNIPPPIGNEPLVCVIDSGVVSGHPLISGWVVEERDFDTGEDTLIDMNGHGTAVSGLVVYGNVHDCIGNGIWEPKVLICSAKVLKHQPNFPGDSDGNAVFPDENRVEGVVEEAIRHFHSTRSCRIFNLSIGDTKNVYANGRQFPWAEKLDELVRELDIVVIITTGNVSAPEIPIGTTRLDFQKKILTGLNSPLHRICSPATSALSLTIGSIARSDALTSIAAGRSLPQDAVVAAPALAPSPFTRTGPGYSNESSRISVKPDLVAYGGNYAAISDGMGGLRWATPPTLLGEPTTIKEADGRFIGALSGTSYSAPQVSHAAAIGLRSLEQSLGQPPSANLIRALVGSSASDPGCGIDWLGGEEKTLNLCGYGLSQQSDIMYSTGGRVRLVAMDELEEDKLHIYRIPIPEQFILERGKRGIVISLAYDPPVRASRKEYLSRTMWFDAVHGLSMDDVIKLKGNNHDDVSSIDNCSLNLRPTKKRSTWSTLQVRRAEWNRSKSPRLRLLQGETEPVLHTVIGCQKRFNTGLDPKQSYGLVVLFWHQNEAIDLHQELRTRVNLRATRVRV